MKRGLVNIIRRNYLTNSNYSANQKPTSHVYMDISVDDQQSQRITLEVFSNILPRTSECFLSILSSYKNSKATTIIPGMGVQLGPSVVDLNLPHESYSIPHDQSGIVSLVNHGSDSSSNQLFISFNPLSHLDYQQVAFARVVQGLDSLMALDQYGNHQGTLNANIIVKDCGLL